MRFGYFLTIPKFEFFLRFRMNITVYRIIREATELQNVIMGLRVVNRSRLPVLRLFLAALEEHHYDQLRLLKQPEKYRYLQDRFEAYVAEISGIVGESNRPG